MKLSELARIYKEVNTFASIRFHDAEIVCEHDELFICLKDVCIFQDEELDRLAKLGVMVNQTHETENHILSFVMYI